jgi:hypothetical protein
MASFTWETTHKTEYDGVKFTLRFQSSDLYDVWAALPDPDPRKRVNIPTKIMYTTRAKKACFIWFFDSGTEEARFIRTFRRNWDNCMADLFTIIDA